MLPRVLVRGQYVGGKGGLCAVCVGGGVGEGYVSVSEAYVHVQNIRKKIAELPH
jgi:hypothetical protein